MEKRVLKLNRTRPNVCPGSSDKNDCASPVSTSFTSGVKRKHEQCDEAVSSKRPKQDKPTRYSVNDRLAKCESFKTGKYSANERLRRLRKQLTEEARSPKWKGSSGNARCDRIESNGPDNNKCREKGSYQTADPPSTFDEEEDMDWSPINDEQLAADIRKLRGAMRPEPSSHSSSAESRPFSSPQPSISDDPLYVVVDTNVFISDLNLVKRISKLHDTAPTPKPTVYVPWIVLQELDYFKDGRAGSAGVRAAAKRAVSFINDLLTRKDVALKGQTVHEVLTEEFSNSNADDAILFCCLRLLENRSKIVLLSNDRNLQSKAMVHSIEARSTKTIMDEIDVNLRPKEPSPAERISSIATVACSHIVKIELEKAYGNATYKMISKPPWTLQECLSYLKRFWVPVFSLLITQKQCLKTVDDLLQYVKLLKGNVGDSNESETERFVKLILSLCVYFKNSLLPYEALMKASISQIQKIVQ